MKQLILSLFGCFALVGLLGAAETAATHTHQTAVAVPGTDGAALQTLCVNGEGQVLALVAPPRGYSAAKKNVSSEIRVFSADGKPLSTWKVSFHAHSINVGLDGTVFVAGDGRVARFDSKGTEKGTLELPHIAAILEDKETLKRNAEQQIKTQKESFTSMVKRYDEMKAKIEAKPEADRTAAEKANLKQYDSILKSFDQTRKYYDSMTVETVVAQTTSRLRIINGIAVSSKDVFIACGESKGYGYAIWRMTHDFKEAKQVLSGIGGCCGQMDIQVDGDDLLVAENTKHRFARYDRDGKALGAWGKRGKETDPDCFGGCCNPMNLRAAKDGFIYTAESEGIVKRFSGKGDFLGTVATVKLQGGCKNVSVAVSPKGDRVYFCDQPGSRILIMSQ